MKTLVPIFLTIIATLIIVLFNQNVQGQACGCDFTLSATSTPALKTTTVNIIDAGSFPTYQPGDVFCISAGTYAELRFIDFHGTPAQPLIFKNCGGQVKIDGITYPGIQFRNSSHVRLTGTGNSSFEYGIHIIKAKDGVSGVSIQDLSTDFEVDHLEISDVGFAGIIAKTDPDCARPETWRENFVMKNLYFHDNYIHQIGGEGFYVGGTFGYETSKKVCSGVETFAHLLENVKITNNIIEDTGWDGLQLNLTVVNAEVSNNSIYGYGWKKEFAQNQGISLGTSLVKMFNNKVIQKAAYAVPDSYGISMVSPLPGSYIFNNVVIASADYGIWTHIRTPTALLTPFGTDGVFYINNTVVNSGSSGFFYNAREGSDPRGTLKHYFYNNLIVDPVTVYTNGTFWKKSTEAFIDYNDKEQKDGATLDKNVLVRTTPIVPASEITRASVKFANPAGNDFSILAGSAAIGAGRDVTAQGVTFDINNGSRPIDATFDAGAYEFGATNQSPLAKAGQDITIPVGQTANLDGSESSDPDGSITQYLWTKVSGPSSPTITGANTAEASVTISTAGIYVYKLKVTDNEGATASDQVQIIAGEVTGLLNSSHNNEKIADLYPNPVSSGDKVAVKFNLTKPSDVYMELYSSSGALLNRLPKISQATNETRSEIDLKGLSASNSLILLVIRTNDGFAVKRIVVD